ncbi:MAG: LruC domain-containing protein [Prevotella sp.]|nr:LruC domain-containing protein [Prevotella sp.]
MKKMKMQGMLLAMTAGAVMMGACSRETDLYDPNHDAVDYQQGWQNKFGEIDEEQTWNMATGVRAYINLRGEYTVRIFTENPVSGHAQLLGKTQVHGQPTTLLLDMLPDATSVFVLAQNADEKPVNGYLPITDGQVIIGQAQANARATRAASAESCPTTIGQAVVRTMQNPSRKENGTGEWTNYDFTETLYTLNNVTMNTDIEPWKASDFRAIFGQNGPFQEWQDNLSKYSGEFSGDVQYVMQDDGPVTMTLNYTVTSGTDLFGYYYWRDGEDPAQARKFLVTDKAPANYIKISYNGTDYQDLAGNVDYLSWNNDNIWTRGTAFRLVYFDAQDRASYNFPKGTHIAFFIDHNGYYDFIFNSMSQYNDWTRAYYDAAYHDRAVTYNFRGTTILGFEDWTDFDENDVVFFATGNFKKPIDVETGEEPEGDDDIDNIVEPQSWIIACEDLGSTEDYDFNDIVFSVSHVAGQTTAYITPLAAGGIYPANIVYGSTDLGEVHQLIVPTIQPSSEGTYSLINTITDKGKPGQTIPLTVSEDFTVTCDKAGRGNMGNFAIRVMLPDSRSLVRALTIGAPSTGTTPQMILVPGNWCWPLERRHIETAYPDFKYWSMKYSRYTDWYNNVVLEEVAK